MVLKDVENKEKEIVILKNQQQKVIIFVFLWKPLRGGKKTHKTPKGEC